ncbi:mitochondrial transcription rescue factor 1 [Xenopus laevis]|nr:mitochondrial transcription rescue factor 1 [Xenopus laevis]XP_018118833.1 mitochondrial transcription rescue factor 1 [Xenopus laevis]
MTGVRFSIAAFRNAQTCVRLCQEPYLKCKTCSWALCRHLSYYHGHCRNVLLGVFPTKSTGFLTVSSVSCLMSPSRLKSKKSHKKSSKGLSEEDQEEEEESNPEDVSDYEDEPEDSNARKDYKDLEKAVQSFRFDVILTTGLDISRNKIEEAFYNSLLRLNGEKLWKKSRAVKVGDTLDLIVEEDKQNETTVMRIIFKNVLEEKTSTEKYKVVLRRWKNLKIPKQDTVTAK